MPVSLLKCQSTNFVQCTILLFGDKCAVKVFVHYEEQVLCTNAIKLTNDETCQVFVRNEKIEMNFM